MRKKLISAMLLALLLSLMFVGTAFADNTGPGTTTAAAAGADAPTGSHISDEGRTNGFLDKDPTHAFDKQASNPLCPRHPGG